MQYQDITLVKNSDLFVERLMKENLWDELYTLRVIEEYKKFIYLATKQRVAPSFEIDQVWHTHILFTNDYQAMCDAFVGTFLHHNPNTKEDTRTVGKDQYIATKEGYRLTFGIEPPKDIWTNFKNSHYSYIDLNSHWVIPTGDWKSLLRVFINYIKTKI